MIKGKKILITCCTGFIGSHLAEVLVRQGIGAYLFLSFDLSSYITGEVLMADGVFSIT